MCRPIESSCPTLVPNVTALLGAYQRQHMKDPGRMDGCGPPPTSDVEGKAAVATSGFNMALPPLSFVMMAPSVPAMPWMHAVDAAPPAFLSSIGLVTTQEEEVKVEEWDAAAAAVKDQDQVEADAEEQASELEDLLDFTTTVNDSDLKVDEAKDVRELDDCFDDQEMSILYSFLVDTPDVKPKMPDEAYNSDEDDDGLLHLNLLEGLSPQMLASIMAPPPESLVRTPSPAARAHPKRENDVIGGSASDKRLARRACKRARHSTHERRLLRKVNSGSGDGIILKSTSGDPGGRTELKG